jgi:5-oxoprolinase (ATP-hydrolysing)
MCALNVRRHDLLYSKVVEAPERVTVHDSTSYSRTDKRMSPAPAHDLPEGAQNTNSDTDDIVVGLSGEKIRVLEKLDMKFTRGKLEK